MLSSSSVVLTKGEIVDGKTEDEESDARALKGLSDFMMNRGSWTNLSKLSPELANIVGDPNADPSTKVQVRMHFSFPAQGAVITTLDELTIATIKELTSKSWIVLIETSNHASLC